MANPKKLGRVLAEGKTKIIRQSDDEGEVLIESKDDITAGDGARREVLPRKSIYSTQTTSNVFRLLSKAGIPNHFISRESDTTFRAKRVKMIPIELVARRIAYSSYLLRNPSILSGTRFDDKLVFEMFAKIDQSHDPLLVYDFAKGSVSTYDQKKPIGPDSLISKVPIKGSPFGIDQKTWTALQELTFKVFGVLEEAWADQGVSLVDLKIECGTTPDGQLIVADVIDNDSWRLWPGGDPKRMVDKQLFRDGKPIDYVASKYAWVAEATDQF